MVPSLREQWIRSELDKSTTRLREHGASTRAMHRVLKVMKEMAETSELKHLESLLSYVDHKGSDVRLDINNESFFKEDLPYPAFCWSWKCVLAYKWQKSQHTNLLEFISLLNYVRKVVNSSINHGKRMLHVLDSRVTAAVISKGRSSSVRLNRVSRRFAAYCLAADLYVLPLWTISGWMTSDAGSRLHTPLNQ